MGTFGLSHADCARAHPMSFYFDHPRGLDRSPKVTLPSGDVATRAIGPLLIVHRHHRNPWRVRSAKEANPVPKLRCACVLHLVGPPHFAPQSTEGVTPRHDENVTAERNRSRKSLSISELKNSGCWLPDDPS